MEERLTKGMVEVKSYAELQPRHRAFMEGPQTPNSSSKGNTRAFLLTFRYQFPEIAITFKAMKTCIVRANAIKRNRKKQTEAGAKQLKDRRDRMRNRHADLISQLESAIA